MHRVVFYSVYTFTVFVFIACGFIGCSDENSGSNPWLLTGGSIITGGAGASGTVASGDMIGSGGAVTTGGTVATGGTIGTGGTVGSGGTVAPPGVTGGAGGGTLTVMDGGAATGDGSTAAEAGSSTDATTVAESSVDSGRPPPTGTCLQGTGDFSSDGPYTVQTKEVTAGDRGQFTIYIPTPLEENCPHPMVAWGNGTTVPGGTAYRHFNGRMASWGIVVIASHDDGTASSPTPRIGDGSFHRAGIDYLLAENENPSSEFFGKLSGRAGVSGHSQGGAGADQASTHPAVEANGNVQGSFGRPPGGDVAFLCLTGTEDIATEGCLSSVNAISTPAMYANKDGMSHVATMLGTNAGSQQYARLLSAWFRCFLADDTAACDMFRGGDACSICQESGWAQIFVRNY